MSSASLLDTGAEPARSLLLYFLISSRDGISCGAVSSLSRSTSATVGGSMLETGPGSGHRRSRTPQFRGSAPFPLSENFVFFLSLADLIRPSGYQFTLFVGQRLVCEVHSPALFRGEPQEMWCLYASRLC
ncbi:hypothetical protein E4T56_gene13500 [Termitomyces sp. T112]|nr:hypothetical protein E4T56_gene13500 [Termitomyces sp. T112]